MEEYLVKDYGVIEDLKYLKSVDDIESYFSEDVDVDFDCGQGYYQDEGEFICKICDKFYKVKVKAEIGSSKQDRGDRLYWVESVESVEYEEIDKPKPKERVSYTYNIKATENEKAQIEELLKELNIKY